MESNLLTKEDGIDIFINKCQTVAKNNGFDFSVFLSQTEHFQLIQMLKAYSKNALIYGENTADINLEKDLVFAMTKLKVPMKEASERDRMQENKSAKGKSAIFAIKQREKQYDSKVSLEWKSARSNFYNQICNKLNKANVKGSTQKEILDLFLTYNTIQLQKNIGSLEKYKNQILQLVKQFQSIQDYFSRKGRECMLIQQIIQQKITTLKFIQIEYKKKIHHVIEPQSCRYSVSAFDLFKIIYDNKMLSQAIFKGVEICKFEQFIKQLNLSKNIVGHLKEQFIWMNNFNPSKGLKISIDIQLNFELEEKKDESVSKIKDLAHFCSFFYQVSDVAVHIKLGEWEKLDEKVSILESLWNQMKALKKIKISLQGLESNQICVSSIHVVCSVLFEALTTFTEIYYLSFQRFFVILDTEEYYNKIEENLRLIFKNNSIAHLRLYNCKKFFLLPEINTLQSIDALDLTFRKKNTFFSEMSQKSLSLKSVKCLCMNSPEWKIDDKTLNRLQRLFLFLVLPVFDGFFRRKQQINGRGITLNGVSSQSPSNIKHLILTNYPFGDSIATIFPKLYNLTQLALHLIDCDYEVLCEIPSPYLQQLSITSNQNLTDYWLEKIDAKWPYLRFICLVGCKKVTQAGWKTCKFHSLIQIRFDKNNEVIKYFKKKGIIVQ